MNRFQKIVDHHVAYPVALLIVGIICFWIGVAIGSLL